MHKAAMASTNQTWQTELIECKRVAQLLREELDLSTAIFNTVSAMVVVLNCEGYIVRFNRACEQMTGYAFDEVRNQPFWDLFLAQNEKESVKAVFSSIQTNQLAIAYENDWVIKDGSRRRIAWSNAPLLDANGAVKYVIGTGIDITEFKQTEKALNTMLEELTVADEELRLQNEELAKAREAVERERQRYQDLFESAPDSYLVTSPEGLIQEANRAAGTIMGVSPMFLVGKPIVNFIPQSERRAFRLKLLQLAHMDRLQDWTVLLQPRNGMPFYAALTVAAVRDQHGELIALRWLLRDITERKQTEETLRTLHEELELRVQERTRELAETNQRLQAEVVERQRTEEALRAEETRFRTLFEQSPLSIQILAPDGRTLQVNRAYEELWGATLTEIASYNLLEDQQLVDKGIMTYIQKAFTGETTVTPPILYDSKQVVPQGRERWAQSFNYPVKDETGNIREVVLVHQDVTALKQVEQVSRGQTEVLTRTLNLLATEPDLDKFLGQVLAAIVEQLDTSMCALYFHEPATDTLSLHMTYHYGQVLTGGEQLGHPSASKQFPANLNAFWQVLVNTRRPLVINDIANDPLLKHHKWLLRNGVKMLLIVPLLLGKETIGFLGIRSTTPRRFTPEQTELAQTLAQQATLAVQLTRLAKQGQQSAVLEERNRMAREIHDTLAQAFTGIILQLGVAQRIAKKQPEEAWSLVKRVSELAHVGLAEARRSVWALCPEALEYSDLANALARSVEQMTSSFGLQAQVCIQGAPRALPPEVGLNLLRIGQEALTNALKHAQAQAIWIELVFEAQRVRLCVRDNGQGFELQHQTDSGGFGLIGMRQRSNSIGGQLTISSQPGRGTEVVVQVLLAKT